MGYKKRPRRVFHFIFLHKICARGFEYPCAYFDFWNLYRVKDSCPLRGCVPANLPTARHGFPIAWPLSRGTVGRIQTGGLLPRGQLLYQLSYSGIEFPALQPGGGTISCHGRPLPLRLLVPYDRERMFYGGLSIMPSQKVFFPLLFLTVSIYHVIY